MTLVGEDNANVEAWGDTESQHAVDISAHHLQVQEVDVELREGVETLGGESGLNQLHLVLQLGLELDLLLVAFIVVGELPQYKACLAALL